MTLLIGHAPIASEAELARLDAASLRAALQSSVRLPLPSGEDVLVLLAEAIVPEDLVWVETKLVGDASEGLAGMTVMAEAATLGPHTLPTLRRANGRPQALISDLVKVGRQRKLLVSRSLLGQALQGQRPPAAHSEPHPILEAAAIFPHLLRLAEQAAAQGHSLIMRYEEPAAAPRRQPTAALGMSSWMWLLLGADLFALTFLGIAFWRGELWVEDGRFLWDQLLISYLLLVGGFVLPWALVRPRFGLAARSYLLLFALGTLLLVGLLPFRPLPIWFAQAGTAFTASALALALSHLAAKTRAAGA